LRFIAGSRSLDFSLADIGEILAARDHGIAPCQRVLDTMAHSLEDLDRRIAELLELRETLTKMRQVGAALPLDDVQGEGCICYLVKSFPDTREVVISHYPTDHTDLGIAAPS
jgi:DNA-binding transcriptional MerR regulator